jgi:IclR family transcriptional regulator, KDG regulon repressor
MTKDPNDYNVRAVERALQILGCFDDQHQERGISEIAQAVDLHKATAHRIVTTLVNYGYLERAGDGQRYRLGLVLPELGFKVIHRMDLRREALPHMLQLVEQWDETCDLSIFDQGQVFYVEVVRGSRALSIAAAVGQRLPAHCTASGKLFLAHLPGDALEPIFSHPLASHTDNTITSRDELLKQFKTIRNQGYAVDREETEVGVYAIAAPICNNQGKMVAAMSIPSPISRLDNEREAGIVESLKQAAVNISRRLGCKQ